MLRSGSTVVGGLVNIGLTFLALSWYGSFLNAQRYRKDHVRLRVVATLACLLSTGSAICAAAVRLSTCCFLLSSQTAQSILTLVRSQNRSNDFVSRSDTATSVGTIFCALAAAVAQAFFAARCVAVRLPCMCEHAIECVQVMPSKIFKVGLGAFLATVTVGGLAGAFWFTYLLIKHDGGSDPTTNSDPVSLRHLFVSSQLWLWSMVRDPLPCMRCLTAA